MSGRNVYQSFRYGYLGGHFGAYAQQTTNNQPTFVDANLSLNYRTLRYRGYRVGAEFWLNGRIFERVIDDFKKTKDIFTFTQLYGDFYNQFEYFRIRLGRYSLDEEWLTNNVEGLSVDYDGLKNLSFHASWIVGNAYSTIFYNSSFRDEPNKRFSTGSSDIANERRDRFFNVVGALYGRGTIYMPDIPLDIMGYFYTAPGIFFSPGIKATLNLPLTIDWDLKSHLHLISYIQDEDFYGKDPKNGFTFIGDVSAVYADFEFGLGIIATNTYGSDLIDAFGQHSGFERPVGVFYGGVTTPYTYLKYQNRFVDASLYARRSFTGQADEANNGLNIDSVEFVLKSTPLEDLGGLELGIGAIYMDNKATEAKYFTTIERKKPIRDYFSGRDYILLRGFAQFKF